MTPLPCSYVARFVPVRSSGPVEKFSQAGSNISIGPVFEKSARHSGIGPWAANDRVEERRVPAEVIPIYGGPGVRVRAVGEKPLENLPLSKDNRKVQQGGAVDRRPVHAGLPMPGAATLRRIDLAQRKPMLQ